MRRREDPVLAQLNKNKFNKYWDSFMGIFYMLYVLLTFFSILFGAVYVLYYSYYHFSFKNIIVGILVTLFMVHLNGRRPS